METMPRTTLKICVKFYIMAAAFSLIAAVPIPTATDNATTTTAPMAKLTFNQSQCLTNGGSAGVDSSAWDSSCHGLFLFSHVLTNPSTWYPDGVPVGQCSNDSLSIIQFTKVVTDLQSILGCGANGSDLELHIIASVLQTYHSIAVQAASTTTSTATSLSMQIISEMLRGLVLNFFRVISPGHCSCTNVSSCVTTVDLTDKLNLSYLTSNCSLADYIAQHILNDHIVIIKRFRDIYPSCLISEFRRTGCSSWVEEYIRSDSPAYQSVNSFC